MPFSQSSQVSPILQLIESVNPQSLLDVGTGMGQYGFLARTNLEHLDLFEVDGPHARRRERDEWKVRIDGIEVFEKYITPVHDYAYNHIYIGNALELLPTLPRTYEMVLAIDILEHFDKASGLQFIQALQNAATRAIVISTPKEFIPQEVEANPYENHRSLWALEELQALGFDGVLDNDESWIVYCKSMDQVP